MKRVIRILNRAIKKYTINSHYRLFLFFMIRIRIRLLKKGNIKLFCVYNT